MEEVLNVLKVFVDLKYFVVQHKPSPDSPKHILFTLTPAYNEFDEQFLKLLEKLFPQTIYLEISATTIEFCATTTEQDILVDAFGEILRLSLDEDLFFKIVEACKADKPFSRLLEKYKEVEEEKAEEKEEKKDEDLSTLPEIPPPPPSSPELEKKPAPFFMTTSGIFEGSLPEPTPEERLSMRLQGALGQIVRLMKARYEPTPVKHMFDVRGMWKKSKQVVKNATNVTVGDSEAAINMIDKFKQYAEVVGLYTPQDIMQIMDLVCTRLLHVQDYTRIDKHTEEITFLNSAKGYVTGIRAIKEKNGFNFHPLLEHDEPSSPALQGSRS